MASHIIRRIIKTPKAPTPVGSYNQAVIVDKTMYMSGQIGLDPATGTLVQGGVAAETEQVMKNMQAVLEAAGIGFSNVVKTTILLSDINNFSTVNSIYETYFSGNFPARAAYQVSALPKNALVEIEAVAVIGSITDQ